MNLLKFTAFPGRSLLLSSKKFFADQCFLRASALTFYSLFAVIPILATTLGIAKGFGLEAYLQEQLQTQFQGQETILKFAVMFAYKLLEHSKGGIIAGIGLLLLFASVFRMLVHIEVALNHIWQIKNKRELSQRISLNLALILTTPIILIVSSGIHIFVNKHLNILAGYSVFFGSSLVSLVLVTIFLTWIYRVIPNTFVKSRSAFLAGLITGILFHSLQWATIKFQLGMSSQGAIYGSFIALPVFLVWLQFSWIIILFGAELSYVLQNKLTAMWEISPATLSNNTKNLLLLKITKIYVDQFLRHPAPLPTASISKELSLSPALVQILLNELTAAKILIEAKVHKCKDRCFQIALNIDTLTSSGVLKAIENIGHKHLSAKTTEALSNIQDLPADMLLKDIKPWKKKN